MEPAAIWTIGHSTRTVAELGALLAQVSISLLVDVRSIPRSRTNPQFNADTLPAALAADGITYHHLPALGGLRSRRKDGLPSPNTLWRVPAFRNYADYAATAPFREGLDELITFCGERRCAIMCAEVLWWRCHRRIIADYLLAAGIAVIHIIGPGKTEPARLTAGAHLLADGTVLYPQA
ncbi:MAG: DUF488 family protein [Stellaceae bacterium]